MNAVVSAFLDDAKTMQALMTVDALYCGFCKPQPQAVELPRP